MPQGVRMNYQEQIHDALQRLLQRRNDNAFLIIEEPKTRKFVQFAGSASEGLAFDLPSQTLSAEELSRAKRALATIGIRFDEWDVYDKPGGTVVGKQSGFSKSLGRDLAEATKLTLMIFIEVYDIKEPYNLSFEEN
jgi:hypothetical protein